MYDEQYLKMIYEVFDPQMPRLGPGGEASTHRALGSALAGLPEGTKAIASPDLRLLDVGCGNGAQTLHLARLIKGSILAVDNHQPYLDELQRRAVEAGVADRVSVLCADMANTGLDPRSFEIVWSEGALYSMGFREGLEMCHDLLVPRGTLGVTELSWIRPDPPAECREYFEPEYPAMRDTDANVATIKGCKYEMLSVFEVPSEAWYTDYYAHLERRLPKLRQRRSEDPEFLEFLESIQTEVDIWKKYSDYYGYVFYVMRRRG